MALNWKNQAAPTFNSAVIAGANAGKLLGEGFDRISGATDYFRDNNIADHKRQVADADAGLVAELMEANKLSDPLQREAAYAAARANKIGRAHV